MSCVGCHLPPAQVVQPSKGSFAPSKGLWVLDPDFSEWIAKNKKLPNCLKPKEVSRSGFTFSMSVIIWSECVTKEILTCMYHVSKFLKRLPAKSILQVAFAWCRVIRTLFYYFYHDTPYISFSLLQWRNKLTIKKCIANNSLDFILKTITVKYTIF